MADYKAWAVEIIVGEYVFTREFAYEGQASHCYGYACEALSHRPTPFTAVRLCMNDIIVERAEPCTSF